MPKNKGLKEGEVYVMKTTGEKIFLLSYTGNGDEVDTRRPSVGLNEQTITHVSQTFDARELETMQDHAERQVTEQLIRISAQKQMLLAEQNAQNEVDINAAEPEETKKAALTIMPSKKTVN